MAHVGRSDLESILSFLGDVSGSASDIPYPPRFLERLQGLIPCDSITYEDIDPTDGTVRDIVETDHEDETVDVDVYLRTGPCPTKVSRHVTGSLGAIRTSDVMSPRRYREQPVYREYFRPNGVEHILDLGLAMGDGRERSIILFRPRGSRDFSERDRDVLEMLRPHLRGREASAALRRRDMGGVDGADDAYTLLTQREREVVALVAEGKTNAEIAAVLWVAPSTVKKHLEHVYAKTGIKRRAGVAAGMQRP